MDHFIDIGQHRFLLKALQLRDGNWTAVVHVRRMGAGGDATASVIYRLQPDYASEQEAREAALAFAIQLAADQLDDDSPDG